MEVYTLDPLLRRAAIIDQFESCIWTERWQDKGDFELVLYSSARNRNLLKPGTFLAMNLSHRVMEVETVEDEVDDEGKRILTVSGTSIEKMMEERAAMGSLSDTTTNPKWTLTGIPAVVARKIFHDICVIGILNVQDQIPFINEGTFLFASTIAEPVDPIQVEMEPTTVFTAIKNICDVWNLGFRLIREYDTSKLWFDIYAGSDRTTKQSILPPVLFTPELDNLKKTKELTTSASAKNVAYVFSPGGFLEVYPQDVDPEIDGFERRVLVVNATDITAETEDIPAALLQRGKEELAANRTYSAFDGEINPTSLYIPNRDYFLGDVVEVRNIDSVTNDMRVTEIIYVSDDEGERTYPTLAVNTFINTGSWLSWLANKKWIDMGETEFWADQP